jgi:GNAT superfamily N-acetyltransferase
MGRIDTEVLKREHLDGAIDLVARAFSSDEPMGAAVGLSTSDIQRFLGLVASRIVEDGLSIVARDADSGELAGALIADDFASPLPIEPEKLSPAFLPIFSLLGELDERYAHGTTFSAGECLHLFMLATDRRYRGRGVAHRLVGGCVENGIRKGHRHGVTEATGTISQHTFRKAGFVERFRVSYADFRCDDRAPFASIQGHAATLLMDKPLTTVEGLTPPGV